MRRYWISWYAPPELGPFELHSPWWISGRRCSDDALTICAAIQAADEDAVREVVYASFDERPASLEFRFCHEAEPEWIPFCDRFPRADWMVWSPAEDTGP